MSKRYLIDPTDVRMSRREAAEYLGFRPQTLAVWATKKSHPLPYYRPGGRVMYLKSDLDKFILKAQCACAE